MFLKEKENILNLLRYFSHLVPSIEVYICSLYFLRFISWSKS